MSEQLTSVETRKIIDKFLEKVMQQNPDLYYSATTDVARMIHKEIKENINRLPIEEQVLVKKITTRDIEIILSLN